MRLFSFATVGVLFSLASGAVLAQADGPSPTGPPPAQAPDLPTTSVGRPAPGSPSGAAPHTSPERPQVVATPPTLGVLSESIASPPVPPAWSRQRVAVAVTADPPQIDGRLDDACWRTATHAAGFYPLVTSTPIAPGDQTEVWFCADKTHLYVAFHCLDSQPDHIHASETVRDSGGVFNDDFVGVDVDSQHSHHGFSSFFANARGTQTEQMEGGTASNITWAGDWRAASARTPNGWTCEMSIPFALLRYPRGANTFGLDFFRSLSRNSTTQNWPYLPPQGTGGSGEAQYMHEFTGIAPPFFAPRPIFLPYTLFSGGTGNSARTGLDIKYPLTTTLTGVATLAPDFQTIEQDVTNINFSYTEKLLTDRRPFFAEGANFFPSNDLFYSRRIASFDGGLKIAGKQNNTTVGFLATDARGDGAQSAGVLNVQQDIGQYSHVLLDTSDDVQRGQPSNQTAKLEGVYGWQRGPTRFAFQADHLPSWQGGRAADSKDYFQFSNRPPPGHLQYSVNYTDIGPNFVSNLGFVPELDLRGTSFNLNQQNQFDRGRIQQYYTGGGLSSYQHHTGGFFHNDFYTYAGVNTRDGLNYELDYDLSRRDETDSSTNLLDHFHDHVATVSFNWGGKTLYQAGGLSDNFGRQGGQPYNFLTFSQGVFVARPFNLQLSYNRLKLGGATSGQSILTGTYRLSTTRTVGARIVSQTGVDQGTGLGTDIYFSFGQHVRSGDDVYLLFGDPNSAKTRGKVTLKVIRPF